MENNLSLKNVSLDDKSIQDKIKINIEGKGVTMIIEPEITNFSYNIVATIPEILSDDLAERQDYKITVVSRG